MFQFIYDQLEERKQDKTIKSKMSTQEMFDVIVARYKNGLKKIVVRKGISVENQSNIGGTSDEYQSNIGSISVNDPPTSVEFRSNIGGKSVLKQKKKPKSVENRSKIGIDDQEKKTSLINNIYNNKYILYTILTSRNTKYNNILYNNSENFSKNSSKKNGKILAKKTEKKLQKKTPKKLADSVTKNIQKMAMVGRLNSLEKNLEKVFEKTSIKRQHNPDDRNHLATMLKAKDMKQCAEEHGMTVDAFVVWLLYFGCLDDFWKAKIVDYYSLMKHRMKLYNQMKQKFIEKQKKSKVF